MLSITDYRCVVALHEERSFVRAAAALGVSQPALTARLRRIEGTVGARLFERGRRGADPTPAGTAFMEAARRIIELADQSVEAARDAQRGLGQFLRVGMTQIAAVQVVVPVLSAFREKNPFARVRLTEGTTAGLETQVERNLVDVAFVHPPIHQAGLSEHHILSRRLVAYDPSGVADRRPPTIRYTRKEAPVLVAEIDRREPAGVDIDSLAEVDTIMGAIVLSQAGYGPSVIPSDFPNPFARPDAADVERALDIDLGTSLVWRRLDRRPMVTSFIETCRETGRRLA